MLRSFDPHLGKVQSVAFSPDGKFVASGHDDGDIKLWNGASGKPVRGFKHDTYSISSLAFTPDGTILAAQGVFAISLWDVASGALVRNLEGQTDPVYFQAMAMSPDGTHVASGSTDDLIRVWDAQTGTTLLSLKGHMEDGNAVVFSPDGTTLASAADDKTVKLWDVASAKSASR
jgi:WD40 repeat protein